MKKIEKKEKDTWIIIGLTIGCIILLFISTIIDRKTGKIEEVLKDVVVFTQKIIKN